MCGIRYEWENLFENSTCPRLGVLHHPTAERERGFASERERHEGESLSARARGTASAVRGEQGHPESKDGRREVGGPVRESGSSGLHQSAARAGAGRLGQPLPLSRGQWRSILANPRGFHGRLDNRELGKGGSWPV